MAKYIKLEDVIKTYADSKLCKHIFKKKGLDLVERFFADLPTIEIVHCKDCRRKDKCEKIVVYEHFCGDIYDAEKIHFCEHGERKEE